MGDDARDDIKVTAIPTPLSARSAGVLAALVVGCLGIGSLGSLVTLPSITGWYTALIRPAWTPPNWLFGPVWSTLYVLMAVAAWRVWRVVGISRRPTTLFLVQLALNSLWSFIFFSWHLKGLAAVEIVLLLGVIVWTAIEFRRRDALAGWLFLPYIVWVSYASTVAIGVWWLNR